MILPPRRCPQIRVSPAATSNCTRVVAFPPGVFAVDVVIVVTVVRGRRSSSTRVAAIGGGGGGEGGEAGEELEDEGPKGGEAGGYDAAGGFDGGPDDGAVEGPGEVRVVDFELFS